MPHTDLTAADYCDWCYFAGLYLDNVSHADRYRTFEAKISRIGLTTKIVHDFLASNRGGIDVQAWRNGDVYEVGADLTYRVEQTAAALEAIGAPRIAAKIRTIRNTSKLGAFMESGGDFQKLRDAMKDVDPAKLMEEFRANLGRAMPDLVGLSGLPLPEPTPVPLDAEIESREQIEHLLARYVEANGNTLRTDMAQHGDPRTEPGFDPKHREQEFDRLRKQKYDRELQRETAPKINGLMDKIEQRVAKNPGLKPSKIAKERRELLETYRRYHKQPAAELLPETQQWLKRAARMQDEYSAIFRPQPIDDEALLQRLSAIGAYDVDVGSRSVRVSWAEPVGLTCDWTTFSLSIEFMAGNTKALTQLLDAYDRLCKRFAEDCIELRAEVLESFDIHREMLARWGFEGYELDADGNPTEESILRNAGDGNVYLTIYDDDGEPDDGSVNIQVFFAVEWDEEHGLELGIVDES